MQFADRIYFMDPVQAPTSDLNDDSQIIVFEHSSAFANHPIGDVVKVVGVSFDGYGRLWYTAENGDYIDGPIINKQGRTTNVIGWYDNEVFVYGRRAMVLENRTILSRVRRSDQRRYGVNADVALTAIKHYATAAPWADELFPMPYDSEDVVEAKLRQAKARWDHRMKHAFILREGMQRTWLDYLKEDGIHTDHGLPMPSWDVLVEGTVSVETGTVRTAQRDETLDQHPTIKSALDQMRPARPATSVSIREAVTVGFRTTLPIGKPDYENRSAVSNDTEAVNRGIRDKLENYSALVSPSSIRPVLANLI